MALVFPHPTASSKEGKIGRFLGDGLHYLALTRDRFIDFYLFPECHTKCKTVEVAPDYSSIQISELELYNYASNADYLVFNSYNTATHKSIRKYWNTAEILDFVPCVGDPFFPSGSVAPNLFLNGRVKVQNLNDVVFSKELSNTYSGRSSLLDLNRIAICDEKENNEHFLEIFSMETGQLVSKWDRGIARPLDPFLAVSYVSRNDLQLVIAIFSDKGAHVLDISRPEAQDVSDRYNTDFGLKQDYTSKFLFYDDKTNLPVFISCTRYHEQRVLSVFTDNGFSNLEIDYESHILSERHILQGSNIYEIVVNAEGNLDLVFKSSLPIMERVEHSYRDLAGTAYIDANGVFRESLAFGSSGVLSNGLVEPVKEIFWVGKDMVLISGGTNSVVANTNTGREVASWHKPENTLFACDKFQVCGSKVHTESSETELPFPGAFMFASSGSCLVAASTTKVAIITQDLKVELIIDEEFVFSVFCEGYVSKSGVNFFKASERNILSNEIVSAHLFDDVLFTVSINGELRSGQNQERVNLMLERVHSLSTSGDKMVIYGTNDTYVYSKGEYFSIEAGEYESILVSNDNQVCVTLLEGIVYLKTNAGFRMLKKRIGGVLDYGSVSVCNDKLMCVRKNNLKSANDIIVKHIAGDITNRFQKPNEGGKYKHILFSNNHIFEYSAKQEKVFVYTLQNPELKICERSEDADEVKFWGTRPSLQSDNKVFYSGYRSCHSFQNVLKVENEEIIEDEGWYQICQTALFGEDSDDEMDLMCPYRLGLQPSDYPRSGDHWVVFEGNRDSPQWKVRFVPKSEESVSLDELYYIRPLIDDYNNSLSCIQSKDDPTTYYCASSEEVYKATVDGVQEIVATIKHYDSCSTKYTVNHGLKTKYEPDFIITNTYPTTITILQPEEAEKLAAVQKELIGDSQNANVVSEIDGRFLLTTVMDSKNEVFFTKHGFDSGELKKDLFELFK